VQHRPVEHPAGWSVVAERATILPLRAAITNGETKKHQDPKRKASGLEGLSYKTALALRLG